MTETKKSISPKRAMAELEKLEGEVTKAAEQAVRISHELTKARATHEALDSERWHLLRDRPELENHTGQPTDPKNDLGKLEARRAKAPDPGDLQAQYDHARKIENRCMDRVREFIRDNYDAVVEAHRPRAEAAAQQLADALETTRQAALHYDGTRNRSMGLTGPVEGLTTRVVPGEAVGNLLKALEGWDFPAPVQDTAPPETVAVSVPDGDTWTQVTPDEA